jgi:hypothetical protein
MRALGTSNRADAVWRCRLEGVHTDAEWDAPRGKPHRAEPLTVNAKAPAVTQTVKQQRRAAVDERNLTDA